jgi:protein involved in temperature-dependent protein secretion
MPSMDTDQLIARGEFAQALMALQPSADPGAMLTCFNLLVRLERYAEAETTMQRLTAAAPQLASRLNGILESARAESVASGRRNDVTLAQKRAAVLPPPPFALALVKAAVLHAQADHAGAKLALDEATAAAPKVKGTLTWRNGKTASFTNLVDTDELTGPTLPCYERAQLLDVPWVHVKSLRVLEMATSFDVMWMPCELTLINGEVLQVRVPSLYPGTGRADFAQTRTGQMTSWDRSAGYALGVGQRDLQLDLPDGGRSLVGVLQIARIDLDVAMIARPPEPKKQGFWQKLFG